MIQLLIALLLGILAGTITGIFPGIHPNLLATFVSAIPLAFIFQPLAIIIFITSMALTHTFIDFIPSIYLGAPDEDTALGVMPGHKFLLKGKAHEAVLLTLIGSSSAIIILLIITPIFIFFIPKLHPFINRMMSFFLLWISIFLISKDNSKLQALIIFLLSGFLGISTLNLQINQPLLPLLTGLFGSSTLIFSISQKTKIPKQKIGKLIIQKRQIIKPTILTALISPICSFFPGLGSSQAAIISSSLSQLTKKQFLILLGSINTLVISTSFITLYLLNKTRTGAASAIQQLATLTTSELTYIILTLIITSAIAIPLTIKLSKLFAKNIHKINYTKLSIIILIFLTIITILFTGLIGLIILLAATCLGLTTIYLNIRRSHLMGSLLIPTILLYLPI